MTLQRSTGLVALIILAGCQDTVEPEVNPCIEQFGVAKLELFLEPPIEANPEATVDAVEAQIRKNELFPINWSVCYEQADFGSEATGVTTELFGVSVDVHTVGTSSPPIHAEKRTRLQIILDQSTGVVDGNTRRACIPGLTIVPDGSPFVGMHRVTECATDANVLRPDMLTHDFQVNP